ncbi:hypothetical protein PV569_15565 [Streptomyces scabiei]|uniref:hypothetical protein n=1 Tax=Streptomyces scabiei TaxID=1930 RepID=UPI0029BAB055|nr:hypothetical protein [Streptomyces scabiei]MDX3295125.1 hypothetical protein [Streptomyces scabiei]
MSYTVKYNRTTNHIDGLTVRTTGGGKDMGDHVSYYAENACGSLTRYRFAQGATYATLAEALDAARQGGRKLCKTCEKAAEAQIAAEAETKNEGAPVAAKIKLSEVRGDVPVGSATGSNGTVHAIKDVDENGRNVAYCPTKMKTPIRRWGAAMDQNPNLDLCAGCSKVVPTGPVQVTATNVEIPGLGRTVPAKVITPVDADTTTEKTEKDTMAAKTTMDKAAQDKAAEQIRADIERLPSLIAEGKDDSAKELTEAISKAIPTITGTGAAAIKAKLRAEATKAEKDAKKAKADKEKADKAAAKADKPASKEVAVSKETTLEATLKDTRIQDLVAKGQEQVKALAVSKFKGGHQIAEIILDIRTQIQNKDGHPDLNADTDAAKKNTTKVFDGLLEGLPEEGEDEAADAIRAEVDSIKKSYRNAIKDVRVAYLRSLDNSPEEAKKYAYALEAHPDKKPSEAVAEFHGYELRTRAEIAKADRERKALEKKKIEDAVKAGELSEEEAAASLDGGDDEEKTPKELRAAFVKRMTNSFKKQVKEIKTIENAEEQEEALDELTALLSTLRKELKA